MRAVLSTLQRRLQEPSRAGTAVRVCLALFLAYASAWTGRRAVVAWLVCATARPVRATLVRLDVDREHERFHLIYRFEKSSFWDDHAPELRGLKPGDETVLWRSVRGWEEPARRMPIALTAVPVLYLLAALVVAIRCRPSRALFEYLERCIRRDRVDAPPGWKQTGEFELQSEVRRWQVVAILLIVGLAMSTVVFMAFAPVASYVVMELGAREMAQLASGMFVCILPFVPLCMWYVPSYSLARSPDGGVTIEGRVLPPDGRGVLGTRCLDVVDSRGKRIFRVVGPFASIWVAGALDRLGYKLEGGRS
jgi:hypothetical protein